MHVTQFHLVQEASLALSILLSSAIFCFAQSQPATAPATAKGTKWHPWHYLAILHGDKQSDFDHILDQPHFIGVQNFNPDFKGDMPEVCAD